jgi:hypothetical protein
MHSGVLCQNLLERFLKPKLPIIDDHILSRRMIRGSVVVLV